MWLWPLWPAHFVYTSWMQADLVCWWVSVWRDGEGKERRNRWLTRIMRLTSNYKASERQQPQWRHLCLQLVKGLISIQFNYSSVIKPEEEKRREAVIRFRFVWSNLKPCCWSPHIPFISVCAFCSFLILIPADKPARQQNVTSICFQQLQLSLIQKEFLQNFNSKCQPFLFFILLSSSSCWLHYYWFLEEL